MSKTDKTKPWMIRVAEHSPWAVHDHRLGICTLPETPYDEHKRPWWTHCHWSDWNIARPMSCCTGCGCRGCTGYYRRKAERRASRHAAQRQNLKYVKGAEW